MTGAEQRALDWLRQRGIEADEVTQIRTPVWSNSDTDGCGCEVFEVEITWRKEQWKRSHVTTVDAYEMPRFWDWMTARG